MHDLYSFKQTAKIFGLKPSKLRYWTQTGFITPTVRKQGRLFYTFRDLVGVKAAVELLAAGRSMAETRPSLDALRKTLPARVHPGQPIRVCSDGDSAFVLREGEDPLNQIHKTVMAFRLSALTEQIESALDRKVENDEIAEEPILRVASPQDTAAEESAPVILLGTGESDFVPTPEPTPEAEDKVESETPIAVAAEGSAPEFVDSNIECTEPHSSPTAYDCFLEGFRAEENGDVSEAELWYRRAIEHEPTMAAAHTNLGNLYHQHGHREEARAAYIAALEYEPTQPEARFNLGNLFDEDGDTDRAISELRRVVSACPDFADAHFNLGLILLRVGGVTQARAHLGRYLDLDTDSEWAKRAKTLMKSSN